MKMTTTFVVPGLVHKSDPYDDSYKELGVPNIEVSPNCWTVLVLKPSVWDFPDHFGKSPNPMVKQSQTYRKIVLNPDFSWLN
jgi:hypothetical protein